MRKENDIIIVLLYTYAPLHAVGPDLVKIE